MPGQPQLVYRNLTGDLDAEPALLDRLNKLAGQLGKRFNITSGRRSDAEQVGLWNNRASNPFPVAKPRSLGGGGSNHESGKAADVYVDGKPIQEAIPADQLRKAGLSPLANDAVHVELAGGGGIDLGDLAQVGANVLPGIGGAAAAAGALGLGDELAGVAGNVAGDAAKATAGALVGLVVDAIGENGARVLLSVALVAVAVALIAFGTARALGLRTPPLPIPALAAARALKGAK